MNKRVIGFYEKTCKPIKKYWNANTIPRSLELHWKAIVQHLKNTFGADIASAPLNIDEGDLKRCRIQLPGYRTTRKYSKLFIHSQIMAEKKRGKVCWVKRATHWARAKIIPVSNVTSIMTKLSAMRVGLLRFCFFHLRRCRVAAARGRHVPLERWSGSKEAVC